MKMTIVMDKNLARPLFISMKQIPIHSEHIRLSQFLKLADAVSSGLEAKLYIQDRLVTVNNEVEIRRGRKLRPGDRVEFEGEVYLVAGGEEP